MKSPIQQEILLYTNTRFGCHGMVNKDEQTNKHGSDNPSEILEEACWNGMLKEWYPEIIQQDEEGKDLWMWRIWHGREFIRIELGQTPCFVMASSINPYYFLNCQTRLN